MDGQTMSNTTVADRLVTAEARNKVYLRKHNVLLTGVAAALMMDGQVKKDGPHTTYVNQHGDQGSGGTASTAAVILCQQNSTMEVQIVYFTSTPVDLISGHNSFTGFKI